MVAKKRKGMNGNKSAEVAGIPPRLPMEIIDKKITLPLVKVLNLSLTEGMASF